MFDFIWDFLSTASTVEFIAISVYIGATLATVMMYFNKAVIGKLVRKLLKAKAQDKDSAKSLKELGLDKNPFVASALMGKGALRKLVSEVEDERVTLPDGTSYFTREKPLKVSQGRYYISEESRIRAELRYTAKGSDLVMLIISLLLYLVIAYVVYLFVPFILDFFNQVVS